MSATPNQEKKWWAVHYDYVDNVFEARKPFRAAHLEKAQALKRSGDMLLGGAYPSGPCGGLLIFNTTQAVVENFVQSDPYVVNKLVTDYRIREWSVVVDGTGTTTAAQLSVGSALPSATLYEDTPANALKTDELCKGKKVIFFGVPGAFTPGCSKTHLPGYVSSADKFKTKGVDEIFCVSVNDPFVMSAWGLSANAGGKVRMLADQSGEFNSLLGTMNSVVRLGNRRSKRWSMLVDNGIITQFNVEPEEAPTGLTCSLAEAIKL